jgi:hypothetical protein
MLVTARDNPDRKTLPLQTMMNAKTPRRQENQDSRKIFVHEWTRMNTNLVVVQP